MQPLAPKPNDTTSIVRAIGAGVFICIPVIWAVAILTSKNEAVPVSVQGCYRAGGQMLQVQSDRIIANGKASSTNYVRYVNTNIGPQIELLGNASLEFDGSKQPNEIANRNAIIRVKNDTLVAFTQDYKAIPFVKVRPSAACRKVGNRTKLA
jgi:hypothetical protein